MNEAAALPHLHFQHSSLNLVVSRFARHSSVSRYENPDLRVHRGTRPSVLPVQDAAHELSV
jgi:hypothetical protein